MRSVRYPARITLAVPQEIHDAWVDKVPREQKEVLKLAFIELVKNRAKIKIDIRQEQNTTIYNVVMPSIEVKPVIKNEVKQDVQGLQGDPEVTREYVKALEADIQRLKRVLKAKNEELRQLKQLIDRLRTYARYRDIQRIRKALGVA